MRNSFCILSEGILSACKLFQMHAFPADELMPLSCKGRVRGLTQSRGEVDDALGR